MASNNLLKQGLKFKKLRPGPCCSPNLIKQVKIDSTISKLDSLKQLPININKNQCSFYDANTASCELHSNISSVGDSRPTMCRLFPIWPDFVSNEFDWFTRGPVLSHHSYQPYQLTYEEEGTVSPTTTGNSTVCVPENSYMDKIFNENKSVPKAGEDISLLSVEEVGRKLIHCVTFQTSDDIAEIDFETAQDALRTHIEDVEVMTFLNEFSVSTKQVCLSSSHGCSLIFYLSIGFLLI